MKRSFATVLATTLLTILVAGCQSQNKTAGSVAASSGSTPFVASTHGRRTVWVAPQAGTLLGGGFIDAGEIDNPSGSHSTTGFREDSPALRAAVNNLNAQAGIVAEGWALMTAAVAWQTGVPAETLKRQHSETNLSLGELLVANSLAKGSGKSLEDVLAMRAKTRGWGRVAKQLNINMESVIARARTAGDSLKYAESKRRARREQNLQDNGFGTRPFNAQQAEAAGAFGH